MASPKPKLVTTPKAALYARFSSDMQKDRSIDDQFAVCVKYAERENLDIVHRFHDRAKSGASMFDREGLRDLMEAAKRKEFEVLIVEATDRLSRNQADLPWIFQHLQFYGVKIVTPATGEVNEMQIAFDGISNPGYSKKLAERVKRGHDGIAREGLTPHRPAYGYDMVPHEPGVRVVNPDQAKVVVRIFQEYVSGKSPRQIAADLMRDKIPSPSGTEHWNFQSIVGGIGKKRGMIHNQIYVGVYQKNRFCNVKNPATGKVVTRRADPGDLITAQVPHLRIINQTLWDAAHRLRTERGNIRFGASGQVHRAVIPRKQHLLAGLLRCGECNERMIVTASDRHGIKRVNCSAAHNHQSCTHGKSYNLDKLTTLAVDNMHAELTDPEFIKRQAKADALEYARLEKKNSGARQAAQKDYDRLDLTIKKVARKIEEEEDLPEEVMASLKAMEIKRKGLKERIRLLGAATNVTTLHPHTLTAFGKDVETLHAKLQINPDDPECHMAFGNIVDSIIVHPTAKGERYELSLYARLSAMSGIDLFPTPRSTKEIVAAEGLRRTDKLGNDTSCLYLSAQRGDLILLGRWKAAA